MLSYPKFPLGTPFLPPLPFLPPPQLHNAANANQKEKYEADLKKEIKKLQVPGEGGKGVGGCFWTLLPQVVDFGVSPPSNATPPPPSG